MAALIMGIFIGIGFTLWALKSWAESDEGRRQTALYRAERRIQEARTQAYVAMSDAVVQASPSSAVPGSWPSEQRDEVIDGVAVDVRERED